MKTLEKQYLKTQVQINLLCDLDKRYYSGCATGAAALLESIDYGGPNKLRPQSAAAAKEFSAINLSLTSIIRQLKQKK
jgi:hypothetical protein